MSLSDYSFQFKEDENPWLRVINEKKPASASNKASLSGDNPWLKVLQPEDSGYDILGGASDVLGSIYALPKNLASSFIGLYKGYEGASVVDKDPLNEFVLATDKEEEERRNAPGGESKVLPGIARRRDLRAASQNAAYSASVMLPSAAASIVGNVVAPVVGFGAGGATAYGASARQTEYRNMMDILKKADADKREQIGEGLTKEEENRIKEAQKSNVASFGRWEAGPESAQKVAEITIIKQIAKAAAKGHWAGRALVGAVELLGLDLLGETVTQIGQYNKEIDEGLREGKKRSFASSEDIWDSVSEVYPGVAIQALTMSGGAYGGGKIYGYYRGGKDSKTIQRLASNPDSLQFIPDDILSSNIAYGQELVKKRTKDEELQNAVSVLEEEKAKRVNQPVAKTPEQPVQANQPEQVLQAPMAPVGFTPPQYTIRPDVISGTLPEEQRLITQPEEIPPRAPLGYQAPQIDLTKLPTNPEEAKKNLLSVVNNELLPIANRYGAAKILTQADPAFMLDENVGKVIIDYMAGLEPVVAPTGSTVPLQGIQNMGTPIGTPLPTSPKLLTERTQGEGQFTTTSTPTPPLAPVLGPAPTPIVPTEEIKPAKTPVNFIGFQERPGGKPPIAMVNLPNGSTVSYKPEEHELSNQEDYENAIKAQMEPQGQTETKENIPKGVNPDTPPETRVRTPDGRIGVLNQSPAQKYAWVRFPSGKPGVSGELKSYLNADLEIITEDQTQTPELRGEVKPLLKWQDGITPNYNNLQEGQLLFDKANDRWLLQGIIKRGVPAKWVYILKSQSNGQERKRLLGEVERYLRIEPLKQTELEGKAFPKEQDTNNIIVGSKGQASTDAGTRIDFQYVLTEADDIQTSHDINLRPNPNYPQEKQPRLKRESLATEQHALDIEAKFDPERAGGNPLVSDGAPIVDENLNVESGNLRTIVQKRMYGKGQGGKIRAWLIENAKRFGLAMEQVQKFNNPILVRQRLTSMTPEQLSRFIEEANKTSVGELGESEQALLDAKHLNAKLLTKFVPNEEGNMGTAANRTFLKEFFEIVTTAAEKGTYLTKDGDYNTKAHKRARNALLAKAFEDYDQLEKIIEATDDNSRRLSNAMIQVAPKIAIIKEAIKEGHRHPLDLSKEIVTAAKEISNMRTLGWKVPFWLKQEDMFNRANKDPLIIALVESFDKFKNSGKAMTDLLSRYYNLIDAIGDPDQKSLFGGTIVPTRAELLKDAIRKIEVSRGETQVGLFEGEAPGNVQTEEAGGQIRAETEEKPAPPKPTFADSIRQAIESTPPGVLSSYETQLANDPNINITIPKGTRIAIENILFSELQNYTGELGGKVFQIGSGNIGQGIFTIERPYGTLTYNESTGELSATPASPTSAMATEKAKFGIDKTLLLQTLSKDIVNNDLAGTIANETIQNSLDAFLPKQPTKTIDIKIDKKYLASEDGNETVITVTDNGRGMSKAEVTKNLLRLGAQGKAGTTTRGGYGLAKAGFLLAPKRAVITTVKDGIRTTLTGTREQFFEVKGAGDPSIETSEEFASSSGTTFELYFYSSQEQADKDNAYALDAWAAQRAFSKYIQSGIFVDGISINYDDGFNPSRTITTSSPKSLPQIYPKSSIEIKGNKLSVYFVEDANPPRRDWTGKYIPNLLTLNKGLTLFGIQPHQYNIEGMWRAPEWRVIVDFDLTPDVRDINYPFLRNRTEMNSDISKAVSDIINAKIKKLNEEEFNLEKADFVKMIEKSPITNGIKILIPFKDQTEFDKTAQLIQDNKGVISDLADIFNSFQAVLDKISGKKIELALTVDPKVHGYRSNPEVVGHELYAINPFAITGSLLVDKTYIEMIKAGYDSNSAMAANLVHTLVHEYVHNTVKQHSEDFTIELGRTYTQMTHGALARLEQQVRKFYENHGKILRNIQTNLGNMGEGGSRFQTDSLAVYPSRADQGRVGDVLGVQETGSEGFGEKYNQRAIKKYGLTTIDESVGYITRDGRKIDSSGRRQGSPSQGRNIDHREIAQHGLGDESTDEWSKDMRKFMDKTGNIRIVGANKNELNVDIPIQRGMPSKKQLAAIKGMAAAKQVFYDLTDETGNNLVSGTGNYKDLLKDLDQIIQSETEIKASIKLGAIPKQLQQMADFIRNNDFSREEFQDVRYNKENPLHETMNKLMDKAGLGVNRIWSDFGFKHQGEFYDYVTGQQKSEGTEKEPGTTIGSNLFLDPIYVYAQLKGLKNNIQEALPYLRDLGNRLYSEGKTNYLSWYQGMKKSLSDLWESFKSQMRGIWDQLKATLKEETGAVKLPFGKHEKNKDGFPIPANPPQVDAPTQQKNAYLRDETTALIRAMQHQLPKNQPYSSWMERLFASPEWYQHPVIKNIVQLFADKRQDFYHKYLNDGNASEVVDSSKELRKTDKKAYGILQKIIEYGDTAYQRNKDLLLKEQLAAFEKDVRVKFKASDKVISVWKLHRASYDKYLDLMQKNMKDLIAELEEKGLTEDEATKALLKTLRGHLAEMESWRGFYAPRVRDMGEWVIQGYKKAKDGTMEYYRNHRTSRYSAERLRNKLIREGYVIKPVYEDTKLRESVLGDLSKVDVANAINQAMKKVKGANPELAVTFNDQILEQVANIIKARGFRSSMIHRQGVEGDVVKGYKEDPIERYIVYANNTSRGLAKADVARLAMEELLGKRNEAGGREGGIDPSKEHRAYEVAKKYIAEQLRNMERSDQIIGLARSVATFKYLGFNMRSAFVNTTSMVTTAPAAIKGYVGGNMTSIVKELNVSAIDYARHMSSKGFKLKDANEQDFLDHIQRDEHDNPQMTREFMGDIQSTSGKIWSSLMDTAMKIFGITERWNRGTTMLAAYRIAVKQGQEHQQAMESAINASNKAHGQYGKATLPEWAWGTTPTAHLGKLIYSYSKFGHNYVQMLYDLGFRKHDIKAFTWAMAAPILVGGLAALPFKDEIFWMLNSILRALGDDRDVEKWFWDTVRRYLGGGELIARYGATGALGVDISGSLSIGIGIPKGLLDLGGAAGGVVNDITLAKHFLDVGKQERAAEKLLPTGIANPLRAYREQREGLTTQRGNRIFGEEGRPYIPSGAETGLRAFGFRSSQEGGLSARAQESRQQREILEKLKKNIYEEYRAVFALPEDKRNPINIEKLKKSVLEFNQRIQKYGLLEPPITAQSLARQAKSMMIQNKRQRALLMEQK